MGQRAGAVFDCVAYCRANGGKLWLHRCVYVDVRLSFRCSAPTFEPRVLGGGLLRGVLVGSRRVDLRSSVPTLPARIQLRVHACRTPYVVVKRVVDVDCQFRAVGCSHVDVVDGESEKQTFQSHQHVLCASTPRVHQHTLEVRAHRCDIRGVLDAHRAIVVLLRGGFEVGVHNTSVVPRGDGQPSAGAL